MNSEITDIELLKELADRLEAKSHSLESLAKLNEELFDVNKKLKESEAMKSHFLSNISNEIVNPFSAITGLAKGIMELDDTQLSRARQFASLIFKEAFHLDFQFRNIFLAAEAEAGEMKPEPVLTKLLPLCQDVLDKYALEALYKKMKLQLLVEPENLEVITDPSKIEAILSNLLNNAILFSDPESLISIHCKLVSDKWVLTVADQGPGIKEDFLPYIFDRFTRGEPNINSIMRGNGLGLSVSKDMANLLNGNIEAANLPGRGAIFTLSFPLHAFDHADSSGYADTGNAVIF